MRMRWIITGILSTAIILWAALYIWVLSAEHPYAHVLAQYPFWPVACSTRGCITTATWERVHAQSTLFASANRQDAPDPAATLTTTTRRHLVRHAFLSSPITIADARRYREEVLNIQSDEQLQDVAGVTVAEYDSEVLIPYLQQETLRQQLKVETTEELYTQLGNSRYIVMPTFAYRWNPDTATATHR